LARVQLVECALQFFKLLSSLAELAFRCQALVVGKVFGRFGDERVEIRCGLGRRRGLLALQWPDINFTELTMRVTRAVVDGVVDEVKTESPKMTFRLIPTSVLSCSTGNGNVNSQKKAGSFPVP